MLNEAEAVSININWSIAYKSILQFRVSKGSSYSTEL